MVMVSADLHVYVLRQHRGKEHLFEQFFSPANLNWVYKAVMRNKECGGIDKMSCEQLLPWLLTNKDVLIRSLRGCAFYLKSATKPFNVLIACTCPLITELADGVSCKRNMAARTFQTSDTYP